MRGISHKASAVSHIKNCIFNKYFKFRGRASRAEFWSFFVFFSCITIGVILADTGAGLLNSQEKISPMVLYPLSCIIILSLIFPLCSVTTRRLHDTNHSGRMISYLFLLQFFGYLFAILGFSADVVKGEHDLPLFITGLMLIMVALLLLCHILFLCSKPGDKEENRFGERTKDTTEQDRKGIADSTLG